MKAGLEVNAEKTKQCPYPATRMYDKILISS